VTVLGFIPLLASVAVMAFHIREMRLMTSVANRVKEVEDVEEDVEENSGDEQNRFRIARRLPLPLYYPVIYGKDAVGSQVRMRMIL